MRAPTFAEKSLAPRRYGRWQPEQLRNSVATLFSLTKKQFPYSVGGVCSEE